MDVRVVLVITLLTLPGLHAECIGLRDVGVFVYKVHKETSRVVAAARANCPTCKKGCWDHCFKDIIEELEYDMKLIKVEFDKIDVGSECRCRRVGDSDGDGDDGDGSGDGRIPS